LTGKIENRRAEEIVLLRRAKARGSFRN
jgi:hypothetical protein